MGYAVLRLKLGAASVKQQLLHATRAMPVFAQVRYSLAFSLEDM
jgi:hypothetical protein